MFSNIKLMRTVKIIILIFPALFSQVFSQKNIDGLQKASDEGMYLELNKIVLPVYDRGMIARFMGSRWGWNTAGLYDSERFLTSSGFFMSGINAEGELWSNGVEPALLINDFETGTVEYPNIAQSLFFNSKDVEHFGPQWQMWENAVEMGAEFFDGDGDGKYNAVDLNNNGIWDENEDRPALYGDVMAWSIYNDGLPTELRKVKDSSPQGIEIRQTIWAINDNPNLESVFFVKYSLLNTGAISERHDSVYFSMYSDAFLGWIELIGSDAKENYGYFYSNLPENAGASPISLIVTQLQGPIIPSYDDSAVKIEGEKFLNERIENAKNLNISAVSIMNSAASFNTTRQIRNTMLALNNPDPCTDNNGYINGGECNSVNEKFIYSGDPITGKGWINNNSSDKKNMVTTGPFTLEKNKPQDLIFAFIVGEGKSGLSALEDAKLLKKYVDYYFYEEPQKLPEVEPIIITEDDYFELIWETSEFFEYNSKGYGYDMRFEGFNVYMYRSSSTSAEINRIQNSKKIMSYDVYNEINKIYIEDKIELDTDLIYDEGTQLPSYIYSDTNTGRIKLRIQRDPFDFSTLKKGVPYYISINPFAVNRIDIEKYDDKGSWLVPRNSEFGYVESESIIIKDNKGNPGIVLGENENDPYFKGVELEHSSGNSEVKITYSIYDKSKLTDDIYEIGFYRNENEIYSLDFYLKNLSKNEYLVDHAPIEYYQSNIEFLTDGFLLNFDWLKPGIKKITFEGADQWYKDFNYLDTGVFYLGIDGEQQEVITPVSPRKYSTAITLDKLSDVEIEFGNMSKAYRYLRSAVRYIWAGSENMDQGWVDIPVEAFRKNLDGSKTKLSVGFIENAFPFDTLSHPDLIWNPGDNLQQTKEYLIIFNSEYSDDYSKHIVYTGDDVSVANISLGYKLDIENDSLKSVARSPWFDALYIVGFEMEQYDFNFVPAGKLLIEANKVLSPIDKYLLKIKNEKNAEEVKEQFDKINVYPNPFFADNPLTSYYGRGNDPFITFSHLPKEASIKIYTLGGILVRSIVKDNLSAMYRWNLENGNGIRVASGMFIAVIESAGLGQKVLKFAIIMPQKQVHY